MYTNCDVRKYWKLVDEVEKYCVNKSLSIDIIDDIYMKLHRINLEEVHKELVGRIVKIEK